MAVILKEKQSTYGSPYAYYKVETTDIDNRTANSVDVTFKVTSHLASSSSSLGRSYDLTAGIYLASKWYNFKIKDNESWSGTTNHTKTQTITISNLGSSDTSLTGIKFRVVSSASDKASGLNATACSNIAIPLYHTPPVITGYSIEEQNQILIDAGIDDDIFVTNLSKKSFDINYTLDDATFKSATIYNAMTYAYKGNSLPIVIDFANNPLRIDALGVPIVVSVTDSEDTREYFTNNGQTGGGSIVYDYYEYISYNKISITSTTRAKRVGQTSGQVALDIDGACFNGNIGNIDQTNYKPLLKYKYWKYEDDEPLTYDYTIPSSEITITNGIFNVKDYNIGSTIEYILTEDTTFQNGKTYYTLSGTTYSEATVTVGDTIPSNTYYEVNPMYFDPRNAYRVKIYAEDNFTNTESIELQIQKGIALWSEYEDKIDFYRLTKKKGEVYGENILFESQTGEDGDITLDNTSENYEYLEVLYLYSDDNTCMSQMIFKPNGKKIKLTGNYDNGTYLYTTINTYTISGTTMTLNSAIRWRIATGGGDSTRASSGVGNIKIYRVIGYR